MKKKADVEPEFPKRLLKVREAAVYLSVSPWKLRKLIAEQEFPYIQTEPLGPFLVDVHDLNAFVAKKKKTY